MDTFEAIKKRRSIRGYLDKAVEENKLLKILEAAREAPSASNRQEWRFIVVKDETTRKKLCQAAKGQKFVAEAPVVIACCAQTDNHTMTCGQLCYPIDIAIAIDHMTLVAVALGLGTCWIGAFDETAAKKLLGVPADVRIIELMPLGYPADKPRPKTRMRFDEIVMNDAWRK